MLPTTNKTTGKQIDDPETQSIIHPVPIVVVASNADPASIQRILSTPDCMLVCSSFVYSLCAELARNMTGEAPVCEGGHPGHPRRFVFTPNPLPLDHSPLPPLPDINPESESEPESEPGSPESDLDS